MNCDEALEAISAALDGELPPAERVKLSGHLMNCPECRELAEDLRVLSDVLERSDREAPPELAAAIQKAVAAETAKPIPKTKPRAPYLRTAAAMLALCAGLGGIGLFAAGQLGFKGDSVSGGAEPALFSAPEERELPNGAIASDAGDGASSIEAEEGMADDARAGEGYDSAQESYEAPGALTTNSAPIPQPSSAPPPRSENDKTAGGTASQEPGEPAPSPDEGPAEAGIGADQALELVFAYLGGYDEYPEASQFTQTVYGFDAPAYYLKTVDNDVGIYVYCLDYIGLSGNGQYYQFRLYEDVTDKRPDGFDHTATSNHFIVSLSGDEVLSECPPDGGDDETWAVYFDAYNSALTR